MAEICRRCSCSLFFTVDRSHPGGRQHPAATKFHVVPTTKNVSLFFSPALAPFLVELRCPVALLSLVLCLSLSLYSKFVDMTIDLSLILQTTRIQKHFPLSVFVLTLSLCFTRRGWQKWQYAFPLKFDSCHRLTCSGCTDGRLGIRYVITKFSCFHRLPTGRINVGR